MPHTVVGQRRDPVTGTYAATSGTTGIVSWPAPVSDGGSPVLDYTVTMTGEGGPITCTATPPAMSCAVSGLSRGASYAIEVSVRNAVGASTDPPVDVTQPNVPSAPVITGVAPATMDDSTGIEVTWTEPADNGAPITGYVLTATPRAGDASARVAPRAVTTYTCTSSSNSCMIFAPGTTRSYSYVVAADNLAGMGPESAPFVVPDPTPPGPGPVPPGPTLPSPQPVPGPVPPGTAVIEIGGVPDTSASVTPNAADNGLVITGSTYSLEMEALRAGGRPLPLGPGDSLVAYSGQRVEVAGSGLTPGTYTAVYVLDPVLAREGRSLSAPVRVGTVLVGGNGGFAGVWTLPRSVTPGQYILQVVGTLRGGALLSANVGLTVTQPDRRSITITGKRVTGAQPPMVTVAGRTWDLNGRPVTARVKLPGQGAYSTGSSRVIRDGRFTWQRKTGKKVYVYFQADGIRSNRIIIDRAR